MPFNPYTVTTDSGSVTLSVPQPVPSPPTPLHTYYLATDGSDSAAGGLTTPWLTLTHALTVMVPGDKLYFRAGTYTGPFALVSLAGTAAHPYVFQAYPGESVLLTVPTPADQAHLQDVVSVRDSSYVWVVGFEIRGSRGALTLSPTLPRTQTGIIVHNAGNNHRFLNNVIHHCAHCGIKDEQGDAVQLLVDGNLCYDNGVHTAQDHGMYFPSGGHVLRGNACFQNAAWGIHQYSTTPGEPATLHTYNNLFFGNGQAGILQAGPNGTIAYNVSLGDGTPHAWGGGITLYQVGCTGNRIVNNLFVKPVSDSVLTSTLEPAGNTMDYNDLFPRTYPSWDYPYPSVIAAQLGPHNTNVDPLVVSEANHDFRLQSGSPVLGTANPAVLLNGVASPPSDPGLFDTSLYSDPVWPFPPSDTTPPSVSISSPANGGIVSGLVTVAITATDNVSVSSVSLFVDGVLLATLATGPYTVPWDTTGKADGSHTLTATATDPAGNTGFAEITVTVRNIVPDTSPPTCAITSPFNGATVSGVVSVSVSASATTGITGVSLFVDNVLVTSLTAAPFLFAWNSALVGNGSHVLAVRATAGNGVSAQSTITVSVANDTSPPSAVFTAPLAGAVVSGTVSVKVAASDPDSPVSSVALLVDGMLLSTLAAAPYTFSWNTKTVGNGTHTLTAKSQDPAGNQSQVSIAVTVLNGKKPAPVRPKLTAIKDPFLAINGLFWQADITEGVWQSVPHPGQPKNDYAAVWLLDSSPQTFTFSVPVVRSRALVTCAAPKPFTVTWYGRVLDENGDAVGNWEPLGKVEAAEPCGSGFAYRGELQACVYEHLRVDLSTSETLPFLLLGAVGSVALEVL